MTPMAIPRGHRLTIQHPSSAAISFTVSTRRGPSFLQSVLLIIRLATVLGSLVLLLVVSSTHFTSLPHTLPQSCRTIFYSVQCVTREWPTHVKILGALGSLILASLRLHTTETCLVLRTLGLQVSSSSRCYLIPSSQRFIATSDIQDIFIHEAFLGFEVRHYLAVVVNGSPDQIVVVFPRTLPSLVVIQQVWTAVRACLYDSL